ncbi:TonB-dependent hemoglobin/transferrin/lactoferrin family receptor [Mannheimia granulomatis]|uniref:TonB-dependent hemoglobin/transferrin/lactoferrin family receptor n=1 Tax=Mannheimia granulomatis TaxID=85402 RepID=UPI001EEDF141|nr:TonB-dependent hemoglobin/transferrin/lactoferrin family receptor [Mannheimia granulomatis]
MLINQQSINLAKLRPTLLALSISSVLGAPMLYAEELTTELSEVNVVAQEEVKASTEKKNKEAIQQELIQNNRDLVRYSPDVGIVNQGRHQKGFAIRGVEDNRVGISIDGIGLPDSEENSLYKRYGNLNTSRQSIDPELARTIEVSKGADSFNQGSGNLGGGVNYRTLEAYDIVRGGNKFGALYRTGYGTRNNEWVNTFGVGYLGEQLEAVLLYSNRHGHEMESAGGYTVPEDSLQTRTIGSSKQTPDDATHNNHSYLAKLAYRFNDKHRVGVSYSGQNNKNYIIEDSAVYLSSYWREAEDRSKRDTVNVFYEYFPESKWIALAKIDVDYQDTETAAYNYEGTRAEAATKWSPAKQRKPSDTNIRIFNTELKRLNFRLDSQALEFGKLTHQLSFRASTAERDFDVLHKDSVYLSDTWVNSPNSTMMHPIKTKQHAFSLHDKIDLTHDWKMMLGLRYDWAKYEQQELNGLACRNCVKTDNAKFNKITWVAGLEKHVTDAWKVAYNIGTGFRIPNASEMYFDYRDNAAGAWVSNPNLKAERSLTQNLSLQANGNIGQLSVNLHHTKYKDFLWEQETWDVFRAYGREFWRPVQQMQNIDSAKIYGVEVSGKWNLNSAMSIPGGWKLFGSLGYSKGSMSNGADLLSIQPIKAVVGLDYEQTEGKWGIFSRLTFLGAKKAKDAKYLKALPERCVKEQRTPNPYYPHWGEEYEVRCTEYSHETGLDTWKHLNTKAFIVDLYGFYKPTENITLRAGVYNLFNRKYHTWDTLRGLNTTGGVVNSVGVRENYKYGGYPGLQRYYEPGRNFSAGFEYRF